MKFLLSVHEAPNRDLLISVNAGTQAVLQQYKTEIGAEAFSSDDTRFAVFGEFIADTEYDWISPDEIGALIDAPILGIKYSVGFGDVQRAWAYMDNTRTPQDDLADNGRVRFTTGD